MRERRRRKSITRLAEVGYDYALGYFEREELNPGKKSGHEIDQDRIPYQRRGEKPRKLKEKQKIPEINILDVRKNSEFPFRTCGGCQRMPPLELHQ